MKQRSPDTRRARFILRPALLTVMPERLLQHKHCINCGKAVLVTEDFCSDECREGHRMVMSRKRRQLLFMWMGAAAVLVIAVILSLG